VNQLRRNAMGKDPLRILGIPSGRLPVARCPAEPLFGIQSTSSHAFSRHALMGTRLRFTNAIWRAASGINRRSIFNFSADGIH
jgi:hypothetical protein